MADLTPEAHMAHFVERVSDVPPGPALLLYVGEVASGPGLMDEASPSSYRALTMLHCQSRTLPLAALEILRAAEQASAYNADPRSRPQNDMVRVISMCRSMLEGVVQSAWPREGPPLQALREAAESEMPLVAPKGFVFKKSGGKKP